jgi:DNA polymerase (family 10)
MTRPDVAVVAKILQELSQRMELEGGNPYRARAYARAADNLALSPLPLGQLIAEDRLQEVPGIGDALEAVIRKIYATGRHSGLEAMRGNAPEGVLEMLRVPGLKANQIRKLYSDFGINSLAALEEAANTGRLKSLKGYGPAFQAKVLQGIEISRRPHGRHLHKASAIIQYAINEIARVHPTWINITVAGDFRRGCELISDLSLVAVDPQHHDDTKVIKYGELTVYLAGPERYGVALLLATGSQQHLEALIKLAQKKSMTLDRRGLREEARFIAQETEEEIYEALGLPFFPPELRETGEEIKLAQSGKLPTLVEKDDLRGVLHAHTTESDGADTLDAMVEATRRSGYA